MHVSIGEAAQIIGVLRTTLRRWEKEEKLLPDFRTPGQHRRYLLASIDRFVGRVDHVDKRIHLGYSRVSSHDQKNDLARQTEKIRCAMNEDSHNGEVISDLGSGLNFKKKGLNRLIRRIVQGQVSTLYLTHKDRLLRFGSELIFGLCSFYETKVIILDEDSNCSEEQQLAADVIELMVVFSAQLYGRRSQKNRKKVA